MAVVTVVLAPGVVAALAAILAQEARVIVVHMVTLVPVVVALAVVAAEVVLDMDDPVFPLAYVIQVPAAAAVWGF